MKKLLWLDDLRDPFGEFEEWLTLAPIQGDDVEVHWVKDYSEFEQWIYNNGLPDAISFDHDLADEHYTPKELWDWGLGGSYLKSKKYQDEQEFQEKTGLDCAKFLVDYCMDYKQPLPLWYTHSANPVGRDNIDKYLINFLRNT